MDSLQRYDLHFALRRCPRHLLEVMKSPQWAGKVFVGGGFLRSVVCGDPVNDVDVFVSTHGDALVLSEALEHAAGRAGLNIRIHKTPNALTLTQFSPNVQIIHRWVFDSAQAVSDSFDFTCCCAAFWYDGINWQSVCDPRFYPDVAAKRLSYRKPVRNEDAGGSMLRILKYYQKGYRIPLDSLGAVIARLMQGVENVDDTSEDYLAGIITGLLREVDPDIDPNHIAHLPSELEGRVDEDSVLS